MTDIPTADAARILDIATGYMASKQLFQASRIGLFAAVADGADTAGEIAERCGVSERIAALLADAMAAKGLLIRTAGRYELADDAAAYLVGEEAAIDLAPFLTFLDEISYPHWLQFAHTVDTTEPGDLQMDDARWATFMAGVMTYNRLHAQEFGRLVDLEGANQGTRLRWALRRVRAVGHGEEPRVADDLPLRPRLRRRHRRGGGGRRDARSCRGRGR